MSSFSGRDRLVAFDLLFLGDKSQFTSSMEGEWLFLVCNHVTRRPCWGSKQKNISSKNLHENRV